MPGVKLHQHQHRIGVWCMVYGIWRGSEAGERKTFEALTNFSLQFVKFVESPALLGGYQAVADLGFVEGGFCYILAREACAKFRSHAHFRLKPRPFLITTTSPASPIDEF